MALTASAGSDLTLNANLTARGSTITLDSGGAITQTGGAVDPNSLLIQAAGPVTMTGDNTVDLLAANITGAGASLSFNDTAPTSRSAAVGGVNGIATNAGDVTLTTTSSGNLTLNRKIDAGAGNNVTLNAAGSVTQNGGVITAGSLTGSSIGGATLGQGNLVATLSSWTDTGAGVTGLAFNDATALSVGGAVSSVSGPVELTVGTGNLTLASGATASGNGIALSTPGAVMNTAGSGALVPGSGRGLVYSAAPAGDTFDGLNSNNTAIWDATLASLPPASVPQSRATAISLPRARR